MYTTDVSDQWLLTLDGDGTAPGARPRSPGVHMSDLIRPAAIAAGLFEADDELAQLPPGQRFPQPAINRMCAGLAWEEWLAKRYAGRVIFHPGEVMLDGVAGSPDGISWDTNNRVFVHEFKLTWKSANKPTQRCWYWVSQIQAYLLGLQAIVQPMGGTIGGGYLHTYHVMGDYRGSGPIYRVMYLEFGQMELVENWAALMQYHPGRTGLGIK